MMKKNWIEKKLITILQWKKFDEKNLDVIKLKMWQAYSPQFVIILKNYNYKKKTQIAVEIKQNWTCDNTLKPSYWLK